VDLATIDGGEDFRSVRERMVSPVCTVMLERSCTRHNHVAAISPTFTTLQPRPQILPSPSFCLSRPDLMLQSWSWFRHRRITGKQRLESRQPSSDKSIVRASASSRWVPVPILEIKHETHQHGHPEDPRIHRRRQCSSICNLVSSLGRRRVLLPNVGYT
jgi:hypothetical protein